MASSSETPSADTHADHQSESEPLGVDSSWSPALEQDLVEGSGEQNGEQSVFECKICQGEEVDSANLVEPCSCSGNLRYAHYDCVQKWIDVCKREDRDICEVCRQPYKLEFKITERPKEHIETEAQMRQRLFQILCSSYLRVLVGIERPNDRFVLEQLAPMFEYVPGTEELTQWAAERIRNERSLSYKFKTWWRKVKTTCSRSASGTGRRLSLQLPLNQTIALRQLRRNSSTPNTTSTLSMASPSSAVSLASAP
mmetsp:Transcript_35705/g.60179  ORF Transcript_35705/g.60179 Transcript_35705/m.60179 type:complete len:254 (-) Transcript_35705:2342-3103(-)|eukprot:CAMPEP_0198198110 /NCGR_PEP_ID=MMETSP1445-20131203/1604_1 /TAXON_ID=36898 /ORGANISM="Pyramimonas sp., Strain CCMP2087" /LENGTH=253 /DNA_ID=CAMNT_0043867573 /DNA_START=399 /DNA_END=1160 /DNA_ORIENTATION=+